MSQGNPSESEIETYCQEFLNNGGDQSAAWRATYTKSNGNAETVWVKASKMHKMVKVQSRIVQLSSKRREYAAEKFDITTKAILERLAIESGIAGENMIPEDSTSSARISALKLMGEHTGGFDSNVQKVKAEVTQEEWLNNLK